MLRERLPSQQIFLADWSLSHQNCVRAACICLHRPTESLKQDIEYVGIADKTNFYIVNFLAAERRRVDQDAARRLILSTIEEKRSRFLLVNSSGKPRYFPTPPSFSIPRMSLTLDRVSCGVFEEKDMEDFAALMSCPGVRSP